MFAEDTIAAVATPGGEGAIAILRLSGPEAVEVADRIFQGRRRLADTEPRRTEHGRIAVGDRILDEVLACVYRAPASYTGEDVVEISCHGGILLTREILKALLERGARAAEPGEFTRRAFMNGKLDLTQAEAVMDLITAQTDLALRSAAEQLDGVLGDRITRLREDLLGLLSHVEAYIDFPEEDIDPETGRALLERLDSIRGLIDDLLATADRGKVLREGVRTVIYGPPNTGKSSLLNLLLGHDRAIVSELPGTTRDTIEEVIDVRGIPLRLVDTAGLRDPADVVEQEGVARTRKNVERADLALHIVDGSLPRTGDAVETRGGEEILVLNKADLGIDPSWEKSEGVRISCKENTGIDRLEETVFQRVMHGRLGAGDSAVAINVRHQRCLARALESCDEAGKAMMKGVSPEFVAVDLHAALEAVGEVIGRADVEDLLDRIFSRFCIGK